MHTPSKSLLWIRRHPIAGIFALGLLSIASSSAQDAKPQATTPSITATADQEAKLVAVFTNATLQGRWAPLKDGQLGAEKEDAYEVVSAKKIEGDRWQVNARVKYQGQSIEMPVPATAKWAGDTIVLLFDGISLGTPRMYSARLMIHENAYSGTWSGGDHGGILYGVIKHGAK